MREVIETQMEAWVAVTTGEKEAEKPEQRSHDICNTFCATRFS